MEICHFFGKVKIFQTLAFSIVIHLALVTNAPSGTIESISKV